MLIALPWLLFAYLVGAFPTGVVIGTLFADVDISAQGSGNIGATNANRVLGRTYGAITLVGDLLKGLLPVLLASAFSDGLLFPGLVALAAFAGHCWSPFLDFRGGKGVATSAGAMLALAPLPTLVAAAVWLLIVSITHKSSLGALVAVTLLPLLCLLLAPDATWIALFLGVGVFSRHGDNLRRLRAGAELSTAELPPRTSSSPPT